MRMIAGCLAVALVGATVVGSLSGAVAAPQEEPENSIKDVMKKAHKDGLLKKVMSGQASDDDKKMLLDLYIDMLEGVPEKGDRGEWIMASGPSVIAAGKVVVGREGALEELKTATNCKNCHDKFK